MSIPCPPEPKYKARDWISINELNQMDDDEQFFHLKNTGMSVSNRRVGLAGKDDEEDIMSVILSHNKHCLAEAAGKPVPSHLLSQYPESHPESAEGRILSQSIRASKSLLERVYAETKKKSAE